MDQQLRRPVEFALVPALPFVHWHDHQLRDVSLYLHTDWYCG